MKSNLQKEIRQRLPHCFQRKITQADRLKKEVVLRRLNRVEYENTIRDIFGVDVHLKEMLPEESKSHGFDNVGSALTVSAEQIGIYLKGC